MADLKPKVSTVVRSQLPDYVQSGYEGFTEFVAKYYEWLEQDQNPNFFLHYAPEQKDIDTATDTFASLHAKEFIRNYHALNIDEKLIVKHIKDFFKAKGSLPSFEMMFQIFFDEPVELEYGRDKIVRPSDITPDTKVVVFLDNVTGDPFQIQGSFLYQPSTGVRGFVDLVAEVVVDGNGLWQLYIDETKLSGDFDDRYEVWAWYREDLNKAESERRVCTGIVQPIIGKINVVKSGPGYRHGDPVGFIGGSGAGAAAHIDSVSPGGVTDLRITRAGTGYKVGDKIYNHDSIEDTGQFVGEITVVDGFGCKLQPVLGLDEWVIQDPGYGYKVNDLIYFYPNPTQAATLRVTAVKDTDLLYDVNITNGGVGYQYVALGVYDNSGTFMQRVWCTFSKDARGSLKDITFNLLDPRNAPKAWVANTNYVAGDQFSYNGTWYRVLYDYLSGSAYGNLDTTNAEKYGPNKDGFDLDGYADQIYVNGYGGSIIPVVSGSNITSWVVEDGGKNYVQPVLRVNGTVIGNAVNVTPSYSGAGVTSVSGTYSNAGISTATSPVSGVTVGDVIINVAVADIGHWREGWSIYSPGLSGTGNVAKILSISYDSDLNKYDVVVSNPFTSVVTSVTVQKVQVDIEERYGYGATVTGQYKNGAVRSLKVVDHGEFTAIDKKANTKTAGIIPNVVLTSIAGNGTTVIYTFDNTELVKQYGKEFVPFPEGAVVTVTGVQPTSYNGTYTVVAGGYDTFEVTKTTTTAVTVLGSAKRTDIMGQGKGLDMRGYYTILRSNILNPGTGYTKPNLVMSNAYGEGVEWSPIIANDAITAITLSSPGAGYTTPTIQVKSSYGHGMDFKARLVLNDSGGIDHVVILDPGHDYIDITAADLEIVGACTSPAVISSVTTIDSTIRKVVVYNGGVNFFHDMIFEQTGGPGTGSTFEVTVTEAGVIKSIQPLTYGTGYTEASTFTLRPSNRIIRSNQAADMWIPFIDMYWPVLEEEGVVELNPKFDYAAISGSGITEIILDNGGSGYWAPTELMPLEITVVDPGKTGSGAMLLPMIDTLDGDMGESPTRSISGVIIVRGGQDYGPNTYIKVVGGRGAGAQIIPIIENGEIVDVFIEDGGDDYYYGTKINILGDGLGASATAQVDTGVYVNIINPGKFYNKDIPPVIAVTDADGKGRNALFRCVVDDYGRVTEVVTINKGLGYLAPQATIVHNGGQGLDVEVYIRRNIEKITLNTKGSKYTTAKIFIQGDGFGASATPKIANSGLTQIKVPYGGCRISAYPKLDVNDEALEGKISQVKIFSTTNNFREVPALYIESDAGVNGEVIALSNTIGKVESIKVMSAGYGYETKPYIATPIILRTDEATVVKRGELVYVPTYNYPIVNGRPDYRDGPHGYVADFEPSKNLIKISPESESIRFLSETGAALLAETSGYQMASEASFEWVGAVKTATTGMDLTIPYDASRAFGVVEVTGQFEKIVYDIRSLLNDKEFRLHNNQDIQEYAYTIVAGLDVREYKKMVMDYLHPAGYEMTGKIKFNLYFDVSMNHEVIEDALGGRYLITITIDLTGPDQKAVATHSGKYEFNIIINLDTQKVKIFSVKGDYYTTNQFAFENKLSFEPAFMWDPYNFKYSDRETYVPTDYYTPWLPRVADPVAEKARLKALIKDTLGRGETVAETQATQAMPVVYPSATPIALFENLTISQMDNKSYTYWGNPHNWARDTNVLINMPRIGITGAQYIVEGEASTFTVTLPAATSSYTINIVTGFSQRAVSADIMSNLVVKDSTNNVLTGTNGNYTVPANETILTVTVTTINDRNTNGWEGVSEAFEINAYAVHPVKGRMAGRKVTRIKEPLLYIVPQAPTVTEGTDATFTITVPVSTVDQVIKIAPFVNAPGFSTMEGDYTDIGSIAVLDSTAAVLEGTNHLYTVPANETTLTVVLTTIDDAIAEELETVYIKAWGTLPETTRQLFSSAKVKLVDND